MNFQVVLVLYKGLSDDNFKHGYFPNLIILLPFFLQSQTNHGTSSENI